MERNQVLGSKKDDQNVSNEFNRFLSSVGKSTTEKHSRKKIQLLARTRPRYLENVLTDQFFFTAMEYFQVKDNVNSIPNNKASGIDKVYHLAHQLKKSTPPVIIVPCIYFHHQYFSYKWRCPNILENR